MEPAIGGHVVGNASAVRRGIFSAPRAARSHCTISKRPHASWMRWRGAAVDLVLPGAGAPERTDEVRLQDEHFHAQLVALNGNPEMACMHAGITDKIRIIRRLDFTQRPRAPAGGSGITPALLAGMSTLWHGAAAPENPTQVMEKTLIMQPSCNKAPITLAHPLGPAA